MHADGRAYSKVTKLVPGTQRLIVNAEVYLPKQVYHDVASLGSDLTVELSSS